MAFATTKDSMLDHEKFLALESDALLKPIERMAAGFLWAKVNTWCAKHRTDGAIPLTMVVKLAADADVAKPMAVKLADALVRARGRKEHGLWEPRDGGYQVHDFTEHNYSAATINALREAGQRGGQATARAKAIGKAKGQAEASASGKPKLNDGFKQVSNPIESNPPTPFEVACSQASEKRPLCDHVGLGESMCATCAADAERGRAILPALLRAGADANDMRTGQTQRVATPLREAKEA